MSTILGLDLGKFKSLACLYDTDTTAARFTTIPTDPPGLRKLLEAERPGLVVFETCTVAGWVADTCAELGLAYLVANPMHEAWSWRNVKRKTDRDDALKHARVHSGKVLTPGPARVLLGAPGRARDRGGPAALGDGAPGRHPVDLGLEGPLGIADRRTQDQLAYALLCQGQSADRTVPGDGKDERPLPWAT